MTTYAGRWGPEALIDGAGNARPNASAQVYLIDGTTVATLYRDRTKATTAANPIDYVPNAVGDTGLDVNGNLTIHADPGEYVITVAVDGQPVYAGEITVPIDPTEAVASLGTHDVDTTNVHGIVDTSALALAADLLAEAVVRGAADANLLAMFAAYVTLATAQTITGLKTVDRGAVTNGTELLRFDRAGVYRGAFKSGNGGGWFEVGGAGGAKVYSIVSSPTIATNTVTSGVLNSGEVEITADSGFSKVWVKAGGGTGIQMFWSTGNYTRLVMGVVSNQTATVVEITNGAAVIFAIDPADGSITSKGSLRLSEVASSPAAVADTAVLFSRDNGSGKTQLCVRFPTGAVQVLSTEP